MSQEINNIIKTLDKNIESLSGVNKIENKDIVILFLDLFGTLRDMWKRFEVIFDKVDELNKIEAGEEKNDYNEIKDEDIKRLYQ